MGVNTPPFALFKFKATSNVKIMNNSATNLMTNENNLKKLNVSNIGYMGENYIRKPKE